MTKMIILGAGASKACPNIDPGMPMPLLRDLSEVLKRLPQSGYHSLAEHLNRLLAVTCGDIELLLTYFYQLNESFFIPRRQYLLNAEWIGQIFRSSALPEVFTDPDDARQVTAILEILQKVAAEQPGSVTFSPANVFTLFQGGLREYFRAAVRSYPCLLHLRMFQNLGANDCVVSFNYDDIADHSLFSAGKLTRSSFEGLGFEEVILPPRAVPPDLLGIPDQQLREGIINRFHRVKFLKVHGSFNWWSYVQEPEYPKETWTYPVGPAPYMRQSPKGGPVVRYCLAARGKTGGFHAAIEAA